MRKCEWSLTRHEKQPELRLFFQDRAGNQLVVSAQTVDRDEGHYIAKDQTGQSKGRDPFLSRDEVRMARTVLTGLGFSNG